MKFYAVMSLWKLGEFEDTLKSLRDSRTPDKTQREETDRVFQQHKHQFVFESEETEPDALRKLVEKEVGIEFSTLCPEHSYIYVWPLPYPTIGELLRAPVVHSDYTTFGLDIGGLDFPAHDTRKAEVERRVRLDTYKFVCPDGNRIWLLSGLFFDNEPVLILQKAGRGGDDFSSFYLISKERLKNLRMYFASIPEETEHQEEQEVPLDKVEPGLNIFYGSSFSGPHYFKGPTLVKR